MVFYYLFIVRRMLELKIVKVKPVKFYTLNVLVRIGLFLFYAPLFIVGVVLTCLIQAKTAEKSKSNIPVEADS